jgi:hypothetical protein
MTMLRDLFNALTYRTDHSTPDPTTGLRITPGRWGARTVHDPRVPGYLNARRARLVREGLDPVDRALLDPATVAVLQATAARIAADRRIPAAARS